MSLRVINVLKIVQIEQHEGEIRFGVMRANHCKIELCRKEPLVAQARQGVSQTELEVVALCALKPLFFCLELSQAVCEGHRKKERLRGHTKGHPVRGPKGERQDF